MKCVIWRFMTTLVMSAAVGFGAAPANAQKQLTDEELQQWLHRTTDFDVRDLKLRVPAPYTLEMGQSPTSRQDPRTLHFQFWVFDGKPLWSGAINAINARDAIGQPIESFAGMYWFWPPEPGRAPILSAGDFLVHVMRLGTAPDGIEGQKRIRGDKQSRTVSRDMVDYGTLKCGVNRTEGFRGSPIICANPITEDPAVYLFGGRRLHLREGDLSTVEMYFYSRADGIDVNFVFPEAGLPRWREIVCRAQSLIRTWRQNGGPLPGDCSKPPRLMMKTIAGGGIWLVDWISRKREPRYAGMDDFLGQSDGRAKVLPSLRRGSICDRY